MQISIAQTVEAIQAILAPAIMISACGLLLLGMQNKYGRINDRMRSLAHERLDLVPRRGEPLADARIAAIDRQMPDLLRRNKTQHDAVLMLFWAVIVFVLDTFLIAASLFIAPVVGNVLALILFLIGMALVLWSSIQAAMEIRISTRAVTLEIQEAMKL
jgi:hypothetical protein